MDPRSLQNRLKSTLERPKSIVSVICTTKSANRQSPSPIFTNFDRFLDSLLEAILVKKSMKNRIFFRCCFFRVSGTSFGRFWKVFWSFWEVKNHFEVVLDAIFWTVKIPSKTLYGIAKIEVRRSSGWCKNELKKRLETWKKHIQRQSTKKSIF